MEIHFSALWSGWTDLVHVTEMRQNYNRLTTTTGSINWRGKRRKGEGRKGEREAETVTQYMYVLKVCIVIHANLFEVKCMRKI